MKKLVLFFFLSILTGGLLFGQQGEFLIEKGNKGLFIEHSVAPREGLYAIGRIYNVHPKYIAAFNAMELNAGLDIGQVIRIPLTDTNFTQHSDKGTPVYYLVGEKEGLMSVSKANNHVLLKSLRAWNGLTSDKLSPGSKLVVGFLVSDGISSLAFHHQEPVTGKQQMSTAIKNEPAKEKKVTSMPESNTQSALPGQPKDELPATRETGAPAESMAENQQSSSRKELTGENQGDQGFFKRNFDQQTRTHPVSKDAEVTAGIFKTTSGWQDGKFYILMDDVPTGTIIRVINPSNDRVIYAKVLGVMNGIRQNEGYHVRISNAAAATLGVSDMDKFMVKVHY